MVWALRSHAWSTVVLDSFCLITISGFALLHLLPESAEQAGWMVLPLAMLGFILPSIAERTLHHGHPGMRKTVIWLAILGIAAHANPRMALVAGKMLHNLPSHRLVFPARSLVCLLRWQRRLSRALRIRCPI